MPKFHRSSIYIIPVVKFSNRSIQKLFSFLQRTFMGYCKVFYSPGNPKNQNFETLKKTPGDIIILHKWIKNHNHRLCCSLDMARNGCNCYFLYWAIFSTFTSLTAWKIKIKKKKRKKEPGIYNSVPKIMIKCCTVSEIWCVMNVIIFSFGPFFTLLPP